MELAGATPQGELWFSLLEDWTQQWHLSGRLGEERLMRNLQSCHHGHFIFEFIEHCWSGGERG